MAAGDSRPSLLSKGATNASTDPHLTLYKGGVQIADNEDWAYSNQTDILPAVTSKLGAFALEEDRFDSAPLITLPPRGYSAQVASRCGESGVVLLEVYEVPE